MPTGVSSVNINGTNYTSSPVKFNGGTNISYTVNYNSGYFGQSSQSFQLLNNTNLNIRSVQECFLKIRLYTTNASILTLESCTWIDLCLLGNSGSADVHDLTSSVPSEKGTNYIQYNLSNRNNSKIVNGKQYYLKAIYINWRKSLTNNSYKLDFCYNSSSNTSIKSQSIGIGVTGSFDVNGLTYHSTNNSYINVNSVANFYVKATSI